HVADEVAAALTLTCRSADRLLHLAAALTRLPAAAAALAAGRIDMPKAIAFTDELSGLGDVPAAAVAAVAAADAAALTTGELRRLLRRTVLALDPDAATRRREKAQKKARVECWADSSGTWSLAGRDLPPAEVLAADQSIDAAARDLKAAGAEGTLDYLRSRVFLARLSGQPLWALLPGQDHAGCAGDAAGPGQDGRGPGGGRDGGGQDGDSQDGGVPGADGHRQDGDGQDGDGEDPERGPGGGCPRTGPAAPGGGPGPAAEPGVGLTGTVNLTVPLTTWLGLTGQPGQPGEAAGYGPLDAAACRDLAAALAAAPGSRWCLTITSPRGAALGHGCAKPGNPPPPGTPLPGSPGPPGAAPPGHGPPGGGTIGHGPPGIRPLGHGPPGSAAPGGGPPGGSGPIPWLAGVTIKWLETEACGHARETFAYQPSPSLRHLVKARDRTCSFPGCCRPARRCDDDHTEPFDQGGRTCECNLSPLCRRHHAAKQAPGWHLRQPRPATLIWTTPSGRTYTTGPGRYPL
ncbi:MAG: HNH endonuclease signature motif containing protein, partial [Streptosporangiaceae bacterium]